MDGYDFKALVEKLKAQGLDVAEGAAIGAATSVLDWLKESAEKSPTPFDDVLGLVITHAKAPLLKELDKINGKVG